MSPVTQLLPEKDDKLSRAAKWVLAITLFYSFSFVSVAFLPFYLRETLHYSFFETGIALSIYGIGTIFASFYGARLCDKFPAYIVSCFSLMLFLTSMLMLYFVHQVFYILVVILLLVGIANSSFLPASRMLLMRYSSEGAQLRANALRYTFYNIGCAASLACVGLLAHENYHIVILCTLCFVLIALVLLLVFVKCDPSTPLLHRAETIDKYCFWRDPFFRLIFAGLFIGMIVFCQLTSSFSLFLNSVYDFNMRDLSGLFIINCIMIGSMQMLIVNRIKRFSQSFIMLLAPFFMGLGFSILLISVNVFTMSLCMVLVTIGEMLFMPVSQNLVYQRAQENLKGYYMGLYQACYAIAVVVSPLIGSTLLNIDHDGRLLWLSILFISALPVFFYVCSRKKITGLSLS